MADCADRRPAGIDVSVAGNSDTQTKGDVMPDAKCELIGETGIVTILTARAGELGRRYGGRGEVFQARRNELIGPRRAVTELACIFSLYGLNVGGRWTIQT